MYEIVMIKDRKIVSTFVFTNEYEYIDSIAELFRMGYDGSRFGNTAHIRMD